MNGERFYAGKEFYGAAGNSETGFGMRMDMPPIRRDIRKIRRYAIVVKYIWTGRRSCTPFAPYLLSVVILSSVLASILEFRSKILPRSLTFRCRRRPTDDVST